MPVSRPESSFVFFQADHLIFGKNEGWCITRIVILHIAYAETYMFTSESLTNVSMLQLRRKRYIYALLLIPSLLYFVLSVRAEMTPVLETLLAFKGSIRDDSNILSDWNYNAKPPCNWTGVVCDSSNTVIRGLNLSYKGLSGFLSPVICQLPNLTDLEFAGNNFNGPFPAWLSNCTKLAKLDLSFNGFGGPLPETISDFRNLAYLDISTNQFSGALPESIGRLAKLEYLNVSVCQFSGSIPPQIGNLSELTTLFLSWNFFSPPYLPSRLSNLTKLQIFSCARCPLSGTIPTWLESWRELEFLELTYNNLTGPIPKELMRFPKLKQLLLYINQLTGEIPAEIGNLTSLTALDLDSNYLTGIIPKEISSLKNLGLVHLWNNSLTGQIPEGLAELDHLYDISLFMNQLTGNLSWDLGKRSNLTILDVSTNQLSGLVPPHFCTGGILQKIILFNNNFHGEFPDNYGSCTSLIRIRVQNNRLSGPVSNGLWGLPRLTYLDISSNFFNGSIPPDIGRAANLQNLLVAHTQISGSLPKELGFCSNLNTLHLDANKLTGEIPSSLGSLGSLIELSLANNQLTGNIPDTFGKLEQLISLDLSHNSLEGNIPSSFANLKLSSFIKFDLSYNNLSGHVPFPLNNAITTASFMGNAALCVPGNPMPKHCSRTGTNRRDLIWIICLVTAICIAIAYVSTMIIKKKLRHMKDNLLVNSQWDIVPFEQLIFDKGEILNSLHRENLIGHGGAGQVYRALLRNGGVVAVKRLNVKRERELHHDHGFATEVETLGSIRHSNILKLLCYLSNFDTNLLVYQYMPNGSLGDFLRGSNAHMLDYNIRYKIALGTGHALSYLHHDCVPPIVHRDVKPDNILLDCELEPHLADFGIAKILDNIHPMGCTVSGVPGSVGYIAPEYGFSSRVNEKSDVYSYGIVLLELLTGKQPVKAEFREEVDIVRWVVTKLSAGENLQQIIDNRMLGGSKKQMLLLLRIGLLCTNKLPSNRPSMREVVRMLLEVGTYDNPMGIPPTQ